MIIKNNVLTEYNGHEKTVEIPYGVTKIGEYAFGWSAIENVIIPDSVKIIGEYAFYFCEKLEQVTLPDGHLEIGAGAFTGCGKLADENGAVIIRGVLYNYYSESDRLEIPPDIYRIEADFFAELKKANITLVIKGVEVPVTQRRVKAFGRKADKVEKVYRILPDSALVDGIINKTTWKYLTAEIQTEIFLSRQSKYLSGAYKQCIYPEQVHPMGECIADQIASVKDEEALEAIAGFLIHYHTFMTDELVVKIYQCLNDNPEAVKACEIIEGNSLLSRRIDKAQYNDASESKTVTLVRGWMAEEQKSVEGLCDDLYTFCRIKPDMLYAVRDTEGKLIDIEVFIWLLLHHEKAIGNAVNHLYEKPGMDKKAQAVVDLLDHESFMTALRDLADHCLGIRGFDRKLFAAYPICRYADESLMSELTKKAPGWKSGRSGIDAPPLRIFRAANQYSNTRAAMLLADRYDELDQYAQLRNTTAEDLRDEVLSDIGLDAEGTKEYDLGNQTVRVIMDKNLDFIVEMPSSQKTAKSLPKKSSDEEKYKKANADFTQLKKDARRVAKNHRDALFREFLDGTAKDVEKWKKANFNNPVFRIMAEMIVWGQGGKTFILQDSKCMDSIGNEYALNDHPVKVAYPAEMDEQDVKE